ncbi:hypothetical protein HYR99_23885 [Candidatus Poribacteria bacterium]|nr:hypothetical protein [Candidatus Poribacteria bacterium]
MKRHLFIATLFFLASWMIVGCDSDHDNSTTNPVTNSDTSEAISAAPRGSQQVRLFRVVAISDAGVDDNGVNHRIGLSGDGKFTANEVNATGNFVHYDNAFPGTPKPIIGSGTFRATKVLSYTGSMGVYGEIDAGIVEMEVDLFPDGEQKIEAILRVICNIGIAGISTGEPEGFVLTVPSAGLKFKPLDPVVGLPISKLKF